jgi:hypothetical protein
MAVEPEVAVAFEVVAVDPIAVVAADVFAGLALLPS